MTLASALAIALLSLVLATAVATTTSRNLLAAAMLLGIYSLLMAAVWIDLAAPDVAFTEAAVGAGISTILLMAAMARVGWEERPGRKVHWPALCGCLVVGLALAHAARDLPKVGALDSAARQHVGGRYMDEATPATHVPNVVTVILADYRAYDTMFETSVIFTAGAGVLLLLRSVGRPKKRREDDGEQDETAA